MLCQVLSLVSFGWYGVACLVSVRMVMEFQRLRLPHWRRLTGVLQILASAGLFAGFFFWPLRLLCSAGLAIMMLVAIIVRIRVNDSLLAATPALCFFLLNLFLALQPSPGA
jgi:uncharacterized membrane protein YphA (DoxX/SURF4 family)